MLISGQRLVIILSDIELGRGDKYDDFQDSESLSKFLEKYQSAKYENLEIDLVFNGDTFDFLKLSVDGKHPHLIDANIGLKKLESIHKAHPHFFQSVNDFINGGRKPRRVYFIVGNHDMELLFPEVQRKLTSICGGSGQIHYPGFYLDIGDVHIQHGNQLDSLFSVDADNLFLQHKNKKILNLSWATVTLLNVVMPHQEDFYELDRVKPRDLIFRKLPEMKEFILGQLWSYWGKDFLKGYMRTSDPLKKVSWRMVKDAFKRSLMFNPDVQVEDQLVSNMKSAEDFQLYVIGHLHNQKITSYGSRKVIQSGCIRDEYMYSESTDSFSLLPKSYVEIWLKDNQVLSSSLKEFSVEMTRSPKPLASYIERLEIKLGTKEERLKKISDQEKQEQKEKFQVSKELKQ